MIQVRRHGASGILGIFAIFLALGLVALIFLEFGSLLSNSTLSSYGTDIVIFLVIIAVVLIIMFLARSA